MRNRVLEISAAVIGVALVGVAYLDRITSDGGLAVEPVVTAPAPVAPAALEMQTPSPDRRMEAVPNAEPRSGPQEPAEDPETAEARAVWQTARADLEAVEAELEVLDRRFDAKEAQLAEMEAQGLDPAALEEDMMIFLDGIVEEYDALETRLADAEAAELAAAERLAALTGSAPR